MDTAKVLHPSDGGTGGHGGGGAGAVDRMGAGTGRAGKTGGTGGLRNRTGRDEKRSTGHGRVRYKMEQAHAQT